MNLLEVNYTQTLADQFNKNGRRRHNYKYIDCTKAVASLEELGSVEWQEWMQRLLYHAATMKIDVLAAPDIFNEYELKEILGKKGIHISLG